MRLFDYRDSRFWKKFPAALAAAGDLPDVTASVATILADIRARGDAALLAYTEKFDRVKLRPSNLRVPPATLAAAAAQLRPSEKRALRAALRALREFHRPTLPRPWTARNLHGARVGERFYPIQRVGLYIPGGSVPLVSSVLMNTVPAVLAGVPSIAAFTPPSAADPAGLPSPLILGALHLCGITEVYRLGGVQAIGAAAYGTRTIPAVDKIAGPGNAYVNEAKRQVFGTVGIDLQPGPSEVMVIADDGANPAHVAADLLAQAEHGTGKEKVFLVCLSTAQRDAVHAALETQLPACSHAAAIRTVLAAHGFSLLAPDLAAAAAIANWVAPEHLELQVADAHLEPLTRAITTAGAILQGYHTPTVLGDFAAGPSHTLPTGRTARFFSGLRAVDFLRRTSIIRYDLPSLRRAAPTVATFSAMEQLDAHGRSLTLRLDDRPLP